jgi:pimeloyl-ACP methyl ester carboxylesterase
MAVTTMARLGFPRYVLDTGLATMADRFSMVGWSDGGITALCAAIDRPEALERIVVWGSNAYLVQVTRLNIVMIHDLRYRRTSI